MKIWLISIFAVLSAEARYEQLLCLSQDTKSKDYTLMMEVDSLQLPIWPDRIKLSRNINGTPKVQFASIDIYNDVFFEKENHQLRRYVAKNYDNEDFKYRELDMVIDVQVEIAKQGTINLSIDFLGQKEAIFLNQKFSCHILR